ncbi:MAG: cation:proton antiporter [Lachnospiraceae bacterium]|nr:cation:proton antiporter [Lachnospiraceae bacterium]
MLLSMAAIILGGLTGGAVCKKIRFPALFGMIIAGIITGPYGLNLIDQSILNISAEIRRIALIIILIRAGLKLDLSDLKKVGRPAVMMCFVPACVEMAGMIILAPVFLKMSYLDAAILGAVIGAVSPAVVVPRMIKLIDEGYGTAKGIPQMILAGASVDDVFVIVMFTTFTGLAQGQNVSIMSFVNIPVSIVLGMIAGLIVGYLLFKWFSLIKMNMIIMTVIVLSVSFILSTIETGIPELPFASLIAIMCMGIAIKRAGMKQGDENDRRIAETDSETETVNNTASAAEGETGTSNSSTLAADLSGQFDKLWTVAEIFLFVLVGASVAIDHAKEAGLSAVILILLVLIFRMLGVCLCVLGTGLSLKEKLFCMIAYTPKATVQAAIGGIPLAMGLSCGETVLTVSVVAILITAPLGAFGIDLTYRKCLKR